MNTIATTNPRATAGTILALDLGKYKSFACLYDRSTAECCSHTLDTSRDNLRQLFQQQGPAVPPLFAIRLTFYSDKGRRCSGLTWFKDRDLSGDGLLAFACPLPGGPENRPVGPFALFADVVTRGPGGDLLVESDTVAVLAETVPPAKPLSP
jgi:hypothetical protein